MTDFSDTYLSDLGYSTLDNYATNTPVEILNFPTKYLMAAEASANGVWIDTSKPIPKIPLRYQENAVVPFSGYQTYGVHAQNNLITTQMPVVGIISVQGISYDEMQQNMGETARINLMKQRMAEIIKDAMNQVNRSIPGNGGAGETFPGWEYWLRFNQASLTTPVGGINRSLAQFKKLRNQEEQNIALTDLNNAIFRLKEKAKINGKLVKVIVVGSNVYYALYAQQKDIQRIVLQPSGNEQKANYFSEFKFGESDFFYDEQDIMGSNLMYGLGEGTFDLFDYTKAMETEKMVKGYAVGIDKPTNQKVLSISCRRSYGAVCHDPQSCFAATFANS